MLISREEMLRRIGSQKNLANVFSVGSEPQNLEPVKIVQAPKPSKVTSISVPQGNISQVIMGALARQGEKVTDIATAFGASHKQVTESQNAVGVDSTIDRIRELAMDRMLIALGLMTPDKFENASLKELSGSAANLSRVIEKTSPQESKGAAVQLIVFAPQVRSEQSYRTVEV